MMKVYSVKTKCRICSNPNLIKYFDFGMMPLANAFKKPGQKEEVFAPQEMMFCPNCANSQLSVVVDPKVMYSNYLYFSSVSNTFQKHCSEMAAYFTKMFSKKMKCLDIASNDGCLLSEFKKLGNTVIGVEPAENVSKIANERGIKTICEFWGKTAAVKVLDAIGRIDVVTATNVFAHVDDVHGFVENVYEVLDDEGVFILEFPYMGNLMRFCEFDTVYHEHLSYFLVKPILNLMKQHKMLVADLSMQDIHGGTIRIVNIKDKNKKMKVSESVKKFLKIEEDAGLHSIDAYRKLEKDAQMIKKEFCDEIIKLKKQGRKIAGYGAPAKGNVFVNYCKIDVDRISFIVDDTKAKQGLIYPGTKIPIVDYSWLDKEKPDYLVILPWNFAKEIINKTQEFKQKGGRYIIAIPELKII